MFALLKRIFGSRKGTSAPVAKGPIAECLPFRFATDAEIAKLDLYLEYGKEPSELESSYPESFRRLKPREEQIQILADLLPDFNSSGYRSLGTHLEDIAEGALIVPGIGKYSSPKGFVACYRKATIRAYRALKKENPGKRFMPDDELKKLQLSGRTTATLMHLDKQSGGKFFSLPIQTGIKYKGIPFINLYKPELILDKNEFGLGPYEVIILLLTHPERLDQYFHLAISCSGAYVEKEFPPPGTANSVPHKMLAGIFFWRIKDNLWVGLNDVTKALPNFGHATGFVI